MMALALKYGWQLLGSRIGLAVVLCAVLFGWHLQDKRQALRAAREGYVQALELTAARKEIETLEQRVAVAVAANSAMRDRVALAETDAQRVASELEEFERETQVNADCAVGPDVLGRLRAN